MDSSSGNEGTDPNRKSDSPVPNECNVDVGTSNAEDTVASPNRTRRLLEAVTPARRDPNNDDHSSEEELEDINRPLDGVPRPIGETRSGLMSLKLRGANDEEKNDDPSPSQMQASEEMRMQSQQQQPQLQAEQHQLPAEEPNEEQPEPQVAQRLLQRPCLDFEKMQQSTYWPGDFDYFEDDEDESF